MIVGILGPGGCGGTFLDWSLSYLSGQECKHYIELDKTRNTIINNSQVEIPEDPLKGQTAHQHFKTHPNDASLDSVIKTFKDFDSKSLHTFYYVDDMSPTQTSTHYNEICLDHPDVKFVVFKFQQSDIDQLFCLQFEKTLVCRTATRKHILETKSIDLDLIPVWDQRELLSLYYPKMITGQILNENLIKTKNNFFLRFSDHFRCLPSMIYNILDFLDVKVDESRRLHWESVYQKWQELNPLHFYDDLNHIVDCIIDGKPLDLTPYKMSFSKEVVIASHLLYNHNLALKSYGVENLSRNTVDWTQIIEPNIYHNLGD